MIRIDRSNIHGKGVFANRDLPKGTIFTCDVLLVPINAQLLKPYHFVWSSEQRAICIGFASFFNTNKKLINIKEHYISKENLTKSFILTEDVRRGQELFLSYEY